MSIQSIRPPRASRLTSWLTCMLALVASIVLTTPDAMAQLKADEAAGRIAPWVNETTILVLRCDISTLDTDAIIDDFIAMVQAGKNSTAEEQAAEKAKLTKARDDAKAWREAFLAAGGREIFATVRFKADDPPIVLVVPTTASSKPDALVAAIKDGFPPDLTRVVKTLSGAVVATGAEESLEGFPLANATRTDDLKRALGAADANSTIQAAFIPSVLVRKAFAELMPTLPKELGGGPTTTVTEGAQWGSISLTAPPPPNGTLKVQLQSASPAAATALVDMLKIVLENAYHQAESGGPPGAAAVTRLLTPKADGDKVVMNLIGKDFETAKSVLVPAMARARAAAQEMVSATQLRGIVQSAIVWAQQNKGIYPPDLPAIVRDGMMTNAMLINPANPTKKPGYGYRQIDPKDEFVSNVVIAYELYDTWPKKGIWVGFADGHVAKVMSEDEFKKLLTNRSKPGK